MTAVTYPKPKPDGVFLTPSKRQIDPILQEVYDVKAQLNADAGYSLERLLERAGLGAISKAAQTTRIANK